MTPTYTSARPKPPKVPVVIGTFGDVKAWFTLIGCGLASEAAARSVSRVDSVEKLKDATTFAGLTPSSACASARWAPLSWQRALRFGSVMPGHFAPPEARAAWKLA